MDDEIITDENWLPLMNPEGYEICDVFPHSIRRTDGYVLKETFNRSNGYWIVTINRKIYYKHRLIATQFIPNPDNLPQVNHKNHVRTDNRISNLEWVSNKQNSNDISHKKGRKIDYVEALPEDYVVVNTYNTYNFNNYYYGDDRFFKQIHNGKYRVIPWYAYNGFSGVVLTDNDNITRHITKGKFKKQYHLP